jgi:N-acetylglucosamine-6-phosphate deacetylase
MTAKRFAIVSDHLFDGAALHEHAAATIEDGHITAVVPRADISADVEQIVLPDGAWLAPGFIDIQVNGGGDVLFNDDPSPATIATIAAAHRRFGTTALLPTLITDTNEKMQAASAAVAEMMRENPSILGIHFEGPYLSLEKPGVHSRTHIRRPEPGDVARLTSVTNGVTLVTIAPETAPNGFVRALRAAGATVALGHSNATYDETRAAMAEGVTGFTHLFNAMRPLSAREPGPIAAALEAEQAFYSLIVDGVHVAPAVLQMAWRGKGRQILITDAMPPVGGRKSSFELYGERISAANGRCVRADGTLAGASLDMATAVRTCVSLLQMPLPQALHAASAAPADFIGLGNKLGRIAPGYRADLIALEPKSVAVLRSWVAGEDS